MVPPRDVLQDFTEWNSELDRLLVAGTTGKRASDVLLIERQKAFRNGVSPADFVSQPNIPFRLRSERVVQTVRITLWSIVLLGVGLIILVSVVSMGRTNTDQQPIEPEQAAPQTQLESRPEINFEVTAGRLAKAYDENAVAANQTFKGNWVALTGIVVDVQDSPPTVRLSGYSGERFSLLNVYCEFEDSKRSEVAKVRAGTRITVYGKVEGSTGIGNPRVIKCRFER